jgi:hypothetical protein
MRVLRQFGLEEPMDIALAIYKPERISTSSVRVELVETLS